MDVRRQRKRGSIPASAGEPCVDSPSTALPTVYPRVRGGARPHQHRPALHSGLSPRPRGSRFVPRIGVAGDGSIPASAGEPVLKMSCSRWQWVYPRVRGGAEQVCNGRLHQGGLSPRPRGSHRVIAILKPLGGSIPASAGEPSWVRVAVVSWGVYPRVRGGAQVQHIETCRIQGLSPRPRGSRRKVFRRQRSGGSIPASAGEPTAATASGTSSKVYPRVRGGAQVQAGRLKVMTGLSPRPRGSRWSR